MTITETIKKEIETHSKIGIFYACLDTDKIAIELGLYDLSEGLSAEFLKHISIQDIVAEKIRDL